jgi:hypothetical protein
VFGRLSRKSLLLKTLAQSGHLGILPASSSFSMKAEAQSRHLSGDS